MRALRLASVVVVSVLVSCAPKTPGSLQFASPTGTSPQKFSQDRLECELAARRTVPEARARFPVTSATPKAPAGADATGGFLHGLNSQMPGVLAALALRKARDEQMRILSLCMEAKGYVPSDPR